MKGSVVVRTVIEDIDREDFYDWCKHHLLEETHQEEIAENFADACIRCVEFNGFEMENPNLDADNSEEYLRRAFSVLMSHSIHNQFGSDGLFIKYNSPEKADAIEREFEDEGEHTCIFYSNSLCVYIRIGNSNPLRLQY